MKNILIAIALLTVPTLALADRDHGGRYREPPRHVERSHGGFNPWPFIAGAVVGGIIIHEADRTPAPISPNGQSPVLVNGVWMQRVLQCVQTIVTDYRGDQNLVSKCNYVYIPIQPPN